MKIGILQTGYVPEEMMDSHGDYPQLFAGLLAGHDFTFQTWAVVDGAFPSGPNDADGWLITGSKHGAYEDHAWIPPLETLIRQIVAADRPLVGICFGHQIIAQAMGGTVEKFSGGWAIGRQTYDFDGTTRTLNAWHQDQVTHIPTTAKRLASNDFCENAALIYGRYAFTVQAHPEFDARFIEGLAEARGRGLVPDAQIDTALADIANPVDNAALSAQIAHFFHHRTPS